MDPLQIFENFKLDTLDEKWINEVWENEFLFFPEPPVDYTILLGSEDMEVFLKNTCVTVKQWIAQNKAKDDCTDDQERTEVSWQTLVALNINIKGLLAVLGYLIKNGQAAGADEDSRQMCLSSTSLYFTLLSIPGSSTFHVFHCNLYQLAIETLKLSEHLVENRKRKLNDLESLYAHNPDAEMLKSEKITLVKGLNSILFELITMLKSFYMKYQIRSLEITVMNLVDVTKLETEINHFQRHQNTEPGASKTSLSYNAYVALQDLCDLRHGSIQDNIKLIMKYFMPYLCPQYLDLPTKAANIFWETIIHFFKNLLHLKGSLAELGMETLIQHLLVNCPDRSEPRQKQAAVVSKLINVCEGKLFLKSINNLIQFSFHNKIPCRIFGQEVIGKLLNDMYITTLENNIDNREKSKIILIATTISRCNDVSSMVRGKAMSTIESMLNSKKFTMKDFINESEEDKILPTEELILNSFNSNANPLPDSKSFNSMLLERIKDERALVRRSSMHAIQSIVLHFPEHLNKVVPVLADHCRDPALSVRRDAVNVLTILLQNNPMSQNLLTEYVKAALPRMYDVETKVQEKVLESLQNLVLDNISEFTSQKKEENENLPWRIIHEMCEQRKRKNLSKVCESWIKAQIITDDLISRIQSHIDSNNDVEVWILLSAIAQNTSLKNMKKYFENYRNILETDDFVNSIKLEVLRNTWKHMKKDYLEELSSCIFQYLCKFNINLESISICIDILDGIIKHLHKHKGEEIMHKYVTNLISISEIQIEKLPEEHKDIDEKMVYTYLKAMNMVGHASFLCSENVSSSTLSVIQSLLLDCDSFNLPHHYVEKLKGAGVVVLGQQALRDRELAEEVMPILGRLMCKKNSSESLAHAAIRINAVKALADICIRFTALVEPYLPDMCISMKDSNILVRETIIVIFVQLLLEDYIKVKGAFFYHILTMLADDDETIRELTIFLIKQRLLVKNKTLISQSLISSIFHYNNCQTKHKFNVRKLRKKEREVLTLPGSKNQAQRRLIYDFMLENLDPLSKLKILTKLNSEVLDGVCEKYINIKQSRGACVLKDTLYIMSNDRMQVLYYSNKTQDEDSQEDNNVATETTPNNTLSAAIEAMKRFKMTVMLNTLITLKQFITACKSPLLKDISKFFVKFMSDFNKDQAAEIYEEHPELKEIDQDTSLFESDPDTRDSECDLDDIDLPITTEVTEEKEDFMHEEQYLTTTAPMESSEKRSDQTSSPKKLQNLQLNYTPRIILRRLSTLTYPGIKNWMSPPHETKSYQNIDPGPSSSGISVSSNSSTDDLSISSPDLFDVESCSKPKPKKLAKLSEESIKIQSS